MKTTGQISERVPPGSLAQLLGSRRLDVLAAAVLVILMPGLARSTQLKDCSFIAPSGNCCTGSDWPGDRGYPDLNAAATATAGKGHAEQTGANLYRLDKSIVTLKAFYALKEYCNTCNAILGGSPPPPLPSLHCPVTNCTIDHLNFDQEIEAVNWYVNVHMADRHDGDSATVFAAAGYGKYSKGNELDFPQPADLTLQISGKVVTGVATTAGKDFYGDCEDQAILRAALLRAKPICLAPASIWSTYNSHSSHEYNIVEYLNAYRVMDWILGKDIPKDSTGFHDSYWGWNETFGPRDHRNTQNNDYLVKHVNNCPAPGTACGGWTPNSYFKSWCVCNLP